MKNLKAYQKVFTHMGEVGRTTGRSTKCKVQDCCGQKIEVKWGKAMTAPCSSDMVYYPTGSNDTMIGDDSWLIKEYHKGLLLLPVQMDMYGIAEKLCPKKDGVPLPMPYNWSAEDVVFTAFESGMTYESVRAMCQTDGLVSKILDRFGSAVTELDWSSTMNDAIAEELASQEDDE